MGLTIMAMFVKEQLAIYFKRFQPNLSEVYIKEMMTFDALRVQMRTLDIVSKTSFSAMGYWKLVMSTRMRQQILKEQLALMRRFLNKNDPLIAKTVALLRRYCTIEDYCLNRSRLSFA